MKIAIVFFCRLIWIAVRPVHLYEVFSNTFLLPWDPNLQIAERIWKPLPEKWMAWNYQSQKKQKFTKKHQTPSGKRCHAWILFTFHPLQESIHFCHFLEEMPKSWEICFGLASTLITWTWGQFIAKLSPWLAKNLQVWRIRSSYLCCTWLLYKNLSSFKNIL